MRSGTLILDFGADVLDRRNVTAGPGDCDGEGVCRVCRDGVGRRGRGQGDGVDLGEEEREHAVQDEEDAHCGECQAAEIRRGTKLERGNSMGSQGI